MFRLMTVADTIGFAVLALIVYKTAELGPQDALVFFGRCFYAFVAAALGYV